MSETAATDTGFYAEEMTINVGPQHPSTHGVLRFVVKTDGEVINEAIPDVGYLHRSIEKIGEKVTYHGYVPYTDRADYLAHQKEIPIFSGSIPPNRRDALRPSGRGAGEPSRPTNRSPP